MNKHSFCKKPFHLGDLLVQNNSTNKIMDGGEPVNIWTSKSHEERLLQEPVKESGVVMRRENTITDGKQV